MSHDVVVIGAGLNGLVAATYLAKAGKRVLVLERRAVVGGAFVTEPLLPGFHVDACLHDAGFLAPRIVADLELEKHGLARVKDASGVVSLLPGGDSLYIDPDVPRAADALRRFSPNDARRWPAFATMIAELAGFLEALYAAPPPRIDAATVAEHVAMLGLGRRLRKMGKPRMVELLRTLPMSASELLDDWFESDALKGTIGGQAVTRLCQGPRSGGTAFTLLHHQVGRATGAVRAPFAVRGGVGALAGALAASARVAGVEVRTGVDVVRVQRSATRATGVELSTGEVIAARQLVSTADPRQTLLHLCDPSRLAPEIVSAVRNVRYRGAWAKVNLALDAKPTFAGVKDDAQLRGAISVAPTLDYLERAYDATKYGRVSDHPYLDVRIPSLADASLAPPGKHVMSVHMQYAPYRLRDGEWNEAARNALGDRVMATLESLAPGIGATVLRRQVLTPLDLESTYSLPEGNAYDGEMMLDQILFMRPIAGLNRYRTPIAGLFLCGSGTHPGGAIAGGAGVLAAKEILRS